MQRNDILINIAVLGVIIVLNEAFQQNESHREYPCDDYDHEERDSEFGDQHRVQPIRQTVASTKW